jgi:hypothetical protein
VRNAGMLWALMEEKSYSWEKLMERSSTWALAGIAGVSRLVCGWIGWGMSWDMTLEGPGGGDGEGVAS